MTIPTKSLINFFSSHLLVNSLSPFWPVTWEGEGKPKIVTKGDKGGRGVKKSHFCGDVIFEWPLRNFNPLSLFRADFVCVGKTQKISCECTSGCESASANLHLKKCFIKNPSLKFNNFSASLNPVGEVRVNFRGYFRDQIFWSIYIRVNKFLDSTKLPVEMFFWSTVDRTRMTGHQFVETHQPCSTSTPIVLCVPGWMDG